VAPVEKNRLHGDPPSDLPLLRLLMQRQGHASTSSRPARTSPSLSQPSDTQISRDMENYTDTQMGRDMSALDDLINRRYAELRAEQRGTNTTQSNAASINHRRSELRVELEPRGINSSAQSDAAANNRRRSELRDEPGDSNSAQSDMAERPSKRT